jgi:hypothetical protein
VEFEVSGICAFCGGHKTLKESHVLPAFVFRWLRGRSGTGHIRQTDNPNKRVQDGLKLYWLCGQCEGQFSSYETSFANKVFHPWHAGEYRCAYDDWLLKFCVSISWRVLKFARGRDPNARYTDEQIVLMDEAELRWRAFLQGKVPHPAKFEQHLVIFDIVDSTTISDLPTNFNRFITGAITLDIVGNERSLMTFAKMGRFLIFGFIQKGSNEWAGTKVHVKHGLLKPSKYVLPAGLLDLFKDKAQHISKSMSEMSPMQREKIDKHILDHLDDFSNSEQFLAMKADADMFGAKAVLRKDEN